MTYWYRIDVTILGLYVPVITRDGQTVMAGWCVQQFITRERAVKWAEDAICRLAAREELMAAGQEDAAEIAWSGPVWFLKPGIPDERPVLQTMA